MAKKKQARQQRRNSAPQRATGNGSNATKVFIALLVVFIAIAAVVSALPNRDRPSCPPGQVWSDAHNHCH